MQTPSTALGRVLAGIAPGDGTTDPDVVHHRPRLLQAPFGFLFKGPLHVDTLHAPPAWVWRPAPAVAEAEAGPPWCRAVGLVDLTPPLRHRHIDTQMIGQRLPTDNNDAEAHQQYAGPVGQRAAGVPVHRAPSPTTVRLCTAYLPGMHRRERRRALRPVRGSLPAPTAGTIPPSALVRSTHFTSAVKRPSDRTRPRRRQRPAQQRTRLGWPG